MCMHLFTTLLKATYLPKEHGEVKELCYYPLNQPYDPIMQQVPPFSYHSVHLFSYHSNTRRALWDTGVCTPFLSPYKRDHHIQFILPCEFKSGGISSIFIASFLFGKKPAFICPHCSSSSYIYKKVDSTRTCSLIDWRKGICGHLLASL